MKKKHNEQQIFWVGEFGKKYSSRNSLKNLVKNNLGLFSKIFNNKLPPKDCLEFGANIGANLVALKSLYPNINIHGVEINNLAYKKLVKILDKKNSYNQSIESFNLKKKFDLVFTKGVLIHINPKNLEKIYEKMFKLSKKYILIVEYYNPKPVSVEYRGHKDKLFKRDFAGEIMKKYNSLKLLDYGFCYHGDLSFPQDDVTWFLLEKKIRS
jgi:pseudaminic acid biosynthesis-associated methylase